MCYVSLNVFLFLRQFHVKEIFQIATTEVKQLNPLKTILIVSVLLNSLHVAWSFKKHYFLLNKHDKL